MWWEKREREKFEKKLSNDKIKSAQGSEKKDLVFELSVVYKVHLM